MRKILCAILCLTMSTSLARASFAEGVATISDPARLIAILKSNESSDFEKAVACKRLAVVGTADAVPILAQMLLDVKFSHYARYALEPIPSPTVDEALREALGKAGGPVRLGILNSLGVRRDAKAVPLIAPLLQDEDPAVVDAAASALGRIANAETVEILQKQLPSEKPSTRRAVGDALLICAEILAKEEKAELATHIFDAVRAADVPKPVRLAAIRGAVLVRGTAGAALVKELLAAEDRDAFELGLRVVRELKSPAVTEELIKAFSGASADKQAQMITVLADMKVEQVRALIHQAMVGTNQPLQLAALRALAKCGGAADIPTLLQIAKSVDTPAADEAKQALVALEGEGIAEALTESLKREDTAGKLVLLEVIGQRRTLAASLVVRELVRASDPATRLAAIRTLGNLGQDEDVAFLADRLISASSDEDVAAVRDALEAACQRVRDREATAKILIQSMAKATGAGRRNLLEVLGVLGGQTALAAVRDLARSDDPELQDAATAVLGNWISPDVAPVLWELIQENAASRYRVRLIRGYIRVARQFNVPDAERLTMCRNALQVSDRPDERRLVMDVLGRNPSAEGLVIAAAELDRPGMQAVAGETVVTIAEKLGKDVPGLRDALSKVMEKTPNPTVKARAQAILERLR
ncbi:MAG: HEAT repeat domain-containing protein [Thermogutta sp.]